MVDSEQNPVASHPPKPRIALSIGVVGHRPNRLPEGGQESVVREIDLVLDHVLGAVASAYGRHEDFFENGSDNLPVAVLSAFAEGADQIAVHAALKRNLPVAAILPFRIDEYEQDFKTHSTRAEFNELLEKAHRQIVLPGTREEEARAYESAGITILDNSDILLAVWDGGASAGRGGTTELIERAARDSIPVVYVDANGKEPTRIIWSGLGSRRFMTGIVLEDLPTTSLDESLDAVVMELLRPPSSETEASHMAGYLQEKWNPRNYWLVVPLLMGLFGVRKPRMGDLLPAGPDELADGFAGTGKGMLTDRVFRPAADAYGWADALAIRYAQIFRGAYIANFILAALAVVLAAGSLIAKQFWGLPKWPFVLAELICIAGVIMITVVGRRRNWHGRWLQAREVAERLRVAAPMWLLGQRPAGFSGDEPTWTGWYARAQIRAIGLSSATLATERLSDIKAMLTDGIKDQCAYHARNAAVMNTVEHRAERLGEVFFVLTFLVVAAYLVFTMLGLKLPDPWSHTVTALSAGLPAMGSATYGIRLIGDFEGVAERSQRTGAALKKIGDDLGASPPELVPLRTAATVVSETMLGDVSHWRLASATRKLAIPG